MTPTLLRGHINLRAGLWLVAHPSKTKTQLKIIDSPSHWVERRPLPTDWSVSPARRTAAAFGAAGDTKAPHAADGRPSYGLSGCPATPPPPPPPFPPSLPTSARAPTRPVRCTHASCACGSLVFPWTSGYGSTRRKSDVVYCKSDV